MDHFDASKLIAELSGFINGWPVGSNRETWKRFRLAVTQEEQDAIVNWYKRDIAETHINVVAYALRGVPLIVETHPLKPLIIVEPV